MADNAELIIGGFGGLSRGFAEREALRRAEEEKQRRISDWAIEQGLGQSQAQPAQQAAPQYPHMNDWKDAAGRGEVSPEYAATATKLGVPYHPDHAEFQGPLNASSTAAPVGPQTEQESLARAYPYQGGQPKPAPEQVSQAFSGIYNSSAQGLGATGRTPVTSQMVDDAARVAALRHRGLSLTDQLAMIAARGSEARTTEGVKEAGRETRQGSQQQFVGSENEKNRTQRANMQAKELENRIQVALIQANSRLQAIDRRAAGADGELKLLAEQQKALAAERAAISREMGTIAYMADADAQKSVKAGLHDISVKEQELQTLIKEKRAALSAAKAHGEVPQGGSSSISVTRPAYPQAGGHTVDSLDSQFGRK